MTLKRICSNDYALDLYLDEDRIGIQDIMKLFNCKESTARRLKDLAKQQEQTDGIVSPSKTTVSIVSAYKAWGIDIHQLIKKRELKQKLMEVK